MGSNGSSGTHDEPLIKGPGVVIGRKGSAGSVQWVDEDFWPIDTTYYVKPKIAINLRYLFYTLNSSGLEELRGGVGIPGLNREEVYSVTKIPLPPLDIQSKIAAEFAEQEKWIEAARSTIAFMEKSISARLADI